MNPFLTDTFDFRKMFNPQKVKNIVTSLPLAFAQFAMMKDARALSKSFENTTIVCPLPLFITLFSIFTSLPFEIVAIIFVLSCFKSSKVFPVLSHQAPMSDLNPLSV